MIRKQNAVQRTIQKLAVGVVLVLVWLVVITEVVFDWLLSKAANTLFGKPV